MAAKVWYEATLVYQYHENQSVNRVIHHHCPDGRVEQVTHTVSFTRPVYLNRQTNLLKCGDLEAFDDYLVPELAGHTTSVDKIAGAKVKPGQLDADYVHHVYYTLLANPDNQPGNSDSDTDQPTGSDTGNEPGAASNPVSHWDCRQPGRYGYWRGHPGASGSIADVWPLAAQESKRATV